VNFKAKPYKFQEPEVSIFHQDGCLQLIKAFVVSSTCAVLSMTPLSSETRDTHLKCESLVDHIYRDVCTISQEHLFCCSELLILKLNFLGLGSKELLRTEIYKL